MILTSDLGNSGRSPARGSGSASGSGTEDVFASGSSPRNNASTGSGISRKAMHLESVPGSSRSTASLPMGQPFARRCRRKISGYGRISLIARCSNVPIFLSWYFCPSMGMGVWSTVSVMASRTRGM